MPTKRVFAVMAVLAAVAGVGGALTGVAVANHQWNDVPSGNFFHDSIDNFTDAGCASGYPGDEFRPTEPVLRQQMARFVNSCGGRLEYDSVDGFAVPNDPAPMLSNLSMVSGAVGEGAGLVLVHIDVHVSTTSTGFGTCEVHFDIPGVTGEDIFVDVYDSGEVIEDVHASMNHSFTLAAGWNSNLFLNVDEFGTCPASFTASAEAALTYYPFASNGDGGAESAPAETESTIPPRVEPGG